MKRETFYFKATVDGKTRIHAIKWIPDTAPVGVIQISHGVTEYIERYEPFAKFMTEKGFVVVGHDHMGHGESIGENGIPMYLGPKGSWFSSANDIYTCYKKIKAEYPDVPYVMLGFSMGSFLLRTALIKFYNMDADAAIIMGTGQQSSIALALAKFMAGQEEKKVGYDKTTEVIDKLTFDTYNKRFAPTTSKFDWLCANKKAVDTYDNDPKRGGSMTVGLFAEMISGMAFTAKQKNINNTRMIPMLFISGADDPVGECGKGVKKAVKAYKKANISTTVKLYPWDRHDILHECDFLDVYDDIYDWIKKVVL